MKVKRILLTILLFVLALSFTGCTKESAIVDSSGVIEDVETKSEYGITINEDTVSYVDGSGEEVIIDKKPERVIVLFSSYIDIWLRNGGELVGMIEDTSGQLIPATEGVETVGKMGSISLEKIISLEPDLVVLSANTSSQVKLIPTLEDNGIQVLSIEYSFLDDYLKTVRLFSAINDREDLYEINSMEVRKDIDEIIEKTPKDNPPKVFIMFATGKSITSRGSNTTVGEVLADLNTINIADAPNDLLDDKNFSIEKIIEEDPDFIFVQTMGSDMDKINERIISDVESNPAWASLSAVKNHRYIFLPKDLYNYKANHRYPEAYEYLAKILYPEVFK